jgi:WD40 repeat protein
VIAFPVDHGLLLVDVSSGGRIRTTLGDVRGVIPSSDGRLVAYRKMSGGNSLVVAHARTGRVAASFPGVFPVALTWAPDATRLALYNLGHGVVQVVDVPRKAVDTVATASPIYGLAWSPDGRMLAYDDKGALVAVDVGTHQKKVLSDDDFAGAPSWSPDGKWVAYVGEGESLYVVDASGGGKPRLIATRAWKGAALDAWGPQHPAWSPDSKLIAFGGGYPSVISVARPTGGAPRAVTSKGGESSILPVWSPDGRRFAYVRTPPGGSSRVYVVNADGSKDTPALADDPAAIPTGPIAWLSGAAVLPASTQQAGVTVTPTRELRLSAAVNELAVDGGRAATLVGPYVRTWSPLTGKTTSRHVPCDTRVYSVALAGERDAAICHEELNTETFNQVSGGGASLNVPECELDDAGYIDCVKAQLELAGGGSLLVASANKELWRLGPDLKLRAYGRHPLLFNVDENRVLLRAEPGLLQVVSASGAVVDSLDVPATGAVLRHDRLTTLSGTELVLRDLRGKAIQQRQVPAASDLLDARGSLVVYRAADRLHLARLSDGRDVTLRLPGQTGRAWARLDPSGLFYAYNGLGSKPGTLGFVSTRRLPKLLAG